MDIHGTITPRFHGRVRTPRGFPLGPPVRLLCACVLCWSAGSSLASWCPAGAQQDPHHAVVYYTGPEGPGPEVNALVAQRYSLGITELVIGQNAVDIKALNPDFQWHDYNSGSDNTIGGSEDALLADVADEHGTDAEECYLHYLDDTRIRIQSQEIFIPGWPDGSAETESDARVVVYYADKSRRATNFSTPLARQIHREVMTRHSIDGTFYQTDLHPDGIFLDNSASALYNTGTVLEGGHIAEDPAHSVIGTSAFQSWRWPGYRTFMHELRDTLHLLGKSLTINVANVWSDDYATYGVADILFLEYCYDPVRSFSPSPLEAWRRDALAASASIRTFYDPKPMLEVSGHEGHLDYGPALLGDLAWNLTTRTSNSLLFLCGAHQPTRAGWDTLTWRGCVEVAQEQLGLATGDPYTFAEGTDPLGNAYAIYARDYDHGLVLLRSRGSWNQGIEPETAVPVALPRPLAPVSPEGEIGSAVTTVSMRNGSAAILLGNPGPPRSRRPPRDP